MGISSDGTNKTFKRADVEAFMARPPDGWGVDPCHPERTVRQAFVAIDPSGGGASAFAIASIIVFYTGAVQARASHPSCRPVPALSQPFRPPTRSRRPSRSVRKEKGLLRALQSALEGAEQGREQMWGCGGAARECTGRDPSRCL